MSVRALLLDLDETLYPSSSGLLAEVDRRINEYVARCLSVSVAEAAATRRGFLRSYGTTWKGLVEVHGFDRVEDYLAAVHPVDVGEYLDPDPELDRALAAIPLPKSILTNSPGEHAERVLDALGIRRRFDRVFDLRFNDFAGKPVTSAYRRALDAIGRSPPEVLFVDDRVDYLLAFRRMGGRVVQVVEEKGAVAGDEGAFASESGEGVPRISSVKELPAFMGYGGSGS